MSRVKGSITIFSLLSLLLVAAVLFALLEGTRYQELRRFAGMQTELALEAVFSNYNLYLWENYHLLGAEARDMKDILQRVANGRSGTDGNLLAFRLEEQQTEAVSRMTDGQGLEYIHAVSAYMEEHLLYETAREIYNQYEGVKSLLGQGEVDMSKIEEAQCEIESAIKEASESSVSVGTSKNEEDEKVVEADALLEAVQNWRQNGVLELVLEDTNQISNAEPDLSGGLLERNLQVGTGGTDSEINWTERILLQQYLLTYMSNYLEKQPERVFSYEIEYLLGKKESDKENLQEVVWKLLWIREVSNFVYLVSNPAKCAQAEAAALTIGGITLSPVVVEVVKLGLLTAWALAESVLDVRALLVGKKIPFIKSEQTWTMELENIGQVADGFLMAQESMTGIGYENYLGILLLLEEETNIAMYAMNIQEASIRSMGNTSFCMDDMITQTQVAINYSYAPVFPFSQVLNVKKPWGYGISTVGNYGYY